MRFAVAYPLSGLSSTVSTYQIAIFYLEMLVFVEERKPENKKTLQARMRTNNKLTPQLVCQVSLLMLLKCCKAHGVNFMKTNAQRHACDYLLTGCHLHQSIKSTLRCIQIARNPLLIHFILQEIFKRLFYTYSKPSNVARHFIGRTRTGHKNSKR